MKIGAQPLYVAASLKRNPRLILEPSTLSDYWSVLQMGLSSVLLLI